MWFGAADFIEASCRRSIASFTDVGDPKWSQTDNNTTDSKLIATAALRILISPPRTPFDA
jgi:hypothetical protein